MTYWVDWILIMSKTTKQILEEQIAELPTLPIQYPDQLYIRQDREYIQSYDPVTSIAVRDNTLVINETFTHALEDFNRIYVTQHEHVDLDVQQKRDREGGWIYE